MSCELFVRFRRSGYHRWPSAPDHRNYLRAWHRHVFHVEVRMPAKVNDEREIEYHDLLDVAQVEWGPSRTDFGAMSCESLAAALAGVLSRRYHREVSVSVSEDGECGATVSVAPGAVVSPLRSAEEAAPTALAAVS